MFELGHCRAGDLCGECQFVVVAGGMAAVLATHQGRFDPGSFEFGVVRSFEGVIERGDSVYRDLCEQARGERPLDMAWTGKRQLGEEEHEPRLPRWPATFAASRSSVSIVRVSSLPEGSPTFAVPPPMMTIGRWPACCRRFSSMIEARLPI